MSERTAVDLLGSARAGTTSGPDHPSINAVTCAATESRKALEVVAAFEDRHDALMALACAYSHEFAGRPGIVRLDQIDLPRDRGDGRRSLLR